MSEEHSVINIKNNLKAKQLLEYFDTNLDRLFEVGLYKDEKESVVLELLADSLEEALENGCKIDELASRANLLAQYALEQGYSEHEVEILLTMHPNPNGDRTPKNYE